MTGRQNLVQNIRCFLSWSPLVEPTNSLIYIKIKKLIFKALFLPRLPVAVVIPTITSVLGLTTLTLNHHLSSTSALLPKL